MMEKESSQQFYTAKTTKMKEQTSHENESSLDRKVSTAGSVCFEEKIGAKGSPWKRKQT